MIAPLFVIFLISWFLLRKFSGESLTVLGLAPSRQRGKEFLFGMAFMAAVAVINFLAQAHLKEVSYGLNPEYGLGKFLGGTFWIFKAVLLEELVFRGAFLFLLIKFLGPIRGCLVSSALFGVYHWFSYEVFGERWILMAYIFLITGAGGWMFAYAYARTRSLYAPTGLHLGWNFVTAIVFSEGPIGEQILVPLSEPVAWNEWFTLVFFLLQAAVAPGIATWYYAKVRLAPSSGLTQP